MAVETKTTIKSYFETGDQPTQAQFENLIDSYQDYSPLVQFYASAGGAGARGILVVSGSSQASFISAGPVIMGILPQTSTTQTVFGLGGTTIGTRLLHVAATASAQGHIGGGTVGRAIFEAITQASAQSELGIQAAAVQGNGRGIEFKTLSTTQVAMIASEIVLKDASGNAVLFQNVSSNVAITGTGAGGLDTGAEAADTFYAGWFIASAGGINGILSTNHTTGPTLPGGWSYRAYIGSVRNNSGSDFNVTHQREGDAVTTAQAVFASATGVTSYTAQDLAAFVPPTATVAKVVLGVANAATQRGVAVASNGTGLGKQWGSIGSNGLTDGYGGAATFDVVLVSGQNVYWRAEAADANTYRLSVAGWSLR